MQHPWRRFREHWGHVALTVEPLPADFHALTDGETVWMHTPLFQVERRCAIEHEMVHLERSEHCVQDAAVERRTEREVARRLIPWGRLLEAVRWARSEQELADELWVTPRVLRARSEALRADELLELARAAQA